MKTIVLPYDSGVSAVRNACLGQVVTQYVLFLDDDFIFHRHTDLTRALAIMDKIDILAGQVLNLPLYSTIDYRYAFLFPTEAQPTMPRGSTIGGLPVYDKVAKLFIARVERLLVVQWDSRLRLMEHTDFFTRSKGILTTVYDKAFQCLHASTPFDKAYMAKRLDIAKDWGLLETKYRSEGFSK